MKKTFLTLVLFTIALMGWSQNVTTYAGKQYLGSGDYNATANNPLLDELYSMPMGICVDNNNRLWVTDQHNIMICDGGTSRNRGGFIGDPNQPGSIGTDNGTGMVSRFNMPSGLCINKNTNDLYIVDTDNAQIRKGSQFVNVSNGTVVSWIAGKYSFSGDHLDGLCADAYFSSPSDIAINSSGEMFICDFGNDCIRKISGGKVSTLAGQPKTSGDADGIGSKAKFYAPSGIWLEDDNHLLIADRNNKKIKRLNLTNNEVTTVVSTGLNLPSDVVEVNGNIYIADQYCIKVFNGTNLKVYAGQESQSGYKDGKAKTDALFGFINLFTFRSADSAFFICDQTNNVIRRLTFINPPVVDFAANKTSVNVDQTVALISNCQVTTSYAWSISPATYTLQGNSKLTDRDLYISFNSTGSYTITLQGSNLSDKTVVSKTNYINVSSISNTAPITDFVANNTTPMTTQIVTLYDVSDFSPTTFNWTFSPNTVTYQNGSSSTNKNPEVKFNALGSYNVTLKASNAFGNNTKVKNAYINVVMNSNKQLAISTIVCYPNPAYNQMTVLGINRITAVELMDMNGRQISCTFNGNVIDLKCLNPGIYVANFSYEAGRVYQTKIVVQR